MLFAAVWMNLEIIIVTEVSQIKTANHDIIYMCSLKEMGQVNLLTKQKWLIENKHDYQRGQGECDKQGVLDWHIHTTVYKIDTPQGPPV